MFYVNEDSATDDVLVVGADPSMTPEDTGVPTCDIPGFDCNCERLPPVDPFSRKPVPTCPNYTWHGMDETGFTGLKQERGWSYENSWLPIPDGWWGADIWLDQWAIFGYEDFEEWKFGVKIRSN